MTTQPKTAKAEKFYSYLRYSQPEGQKRGEKCSPLTHFISSFHQFISQTFQQSHEVLCQY